VKSIRTLAALALGSLAAAPLPAQQPKTDAPPAKPLFLVAFQDSGTVDRAKQTRQMYEDVTVFGSLLTRALAKSYGFSPQAVAPHGMTVLSGVYGKSREQYHQLPLAEGVYLKGRGVVYTLASPTPLQDPVGQAAAAPARQPSEWDNVVAELRGVPKPPAKQAAPARPSLSDALLRLLLENGRHFKQLDGDEQITIAVTFRPSMDCAKCHQADTVRDPRTGHLIRLSTTYQQLGGDRPLLVGQMPGGGGTSQPPPTTAQEIQNASRVGDLHMRQGRYREAVKAYEDALKTLLNSLTSTRKTSADVQRLLTAAELSNRLALAHRALGDKAAEQGALKNGLKMAQAAVKLAESLDGKGQATGGTVPVPARLIVSAPKKLLDKAAESKMSLADFRKAATVEYLRFPPPNAKKGDKGK
jgi:tetratricopeptide (TPR) repeat protein